MVDKIEQLEAERVELLRIQNNVQADLREYKHTQETAGDDYTREGARRNIARAIHTLGRITIRLSEIKSEIRAENVRRNNRKEAA